MAATDVLSQDEADEALKIGTLDTTKDGLITSAISAVSARLDELCGPIVQRTITSEKYITGCRGYLDLGSWPVTSVASMIEYDSGGSARSLTAETHDTKPDNGYRLHPYRGMGGGYTGYVERRSGAGCGRFADQVIVTYTAGRYQNTAAVDPAFKMAARWALLNYLGPLISTQGVVYDPSTELPVPLRRFPAYAMPHAVREALRGEIQERPGIA